MILLAREPGALCVTFTQPLPEAEVFLMRDLKFWKKDLVAEINKNGYPTGKRRTKRTHEKLYRVTTPPGGGYPRTYVTGSGFFRRVSESMRKFDNVRVVDNRASLPKPRYDLTGGFRGSQEEVFRQSLEMEENGVLELVTRYGKSYLMLNFIKAFPGVRTVVVMPGVDLLDQVSAFLRRELPLRDIRTLSGSRKKLGDDITVASVDSLTKFSEEEADRVKLMIVDEVHSCVSNSRGPQMARFRNARALALTGSPEGRYDGADILLESIIGPILIKKDYRAGVAEGAICPIKVFMVRVPLHVTRPVSNRNAAYSHYHYPNKDLLGKAHRILTEIIPQDWQTLVFIDAEKQAMKFKEITGMDVPIAMAKLMTTAERKEMKEKMSSGSEKRCLASSIYAQGLTFSELRCMVNLSGGSGGITAKQRPGRLAEIIEGKKWGYMIDFLYHVATPEFEYDNRIPKDGREWETLVRDSHNRKKLYSKIGYTIVEVSDPDEIQFDELTP